MMKSLLKLIIISVLILMAMCFRPSVAYAWKPTTHVYLAEHALDDALDDGKVTIHRVNYETGEVLDEIVGEYSLGEDTLNALRAFSPQYRAGAIGPDAYPDILTGQQVIHPGPEDTGIQNGSDAWLEYLWQQSVNENSLPVKAFVLGFLTHSAGDVYGHTFVNNFSGGPFAIEPPEGPTNAIKHIVVEGYFDKRIDPQALDSSFYNASILGVENFIYKKMIDARPYTFLSKELLKKKKKNVEATEYSIPRIYSTLRQDLIQDVRRLRRAARNCGTFDFSCSKVALNLEADYKDRWVDDIDRGLQRWPFVSHEVGKALLFNSSRSADSQRAEELLQEYVEDYLLSMSGAPDFVGPLAGSIEDIIEAITPDFLLQPIEDLKEDLINTLLVNSIGMNKEELKQYLSNPERYFDQVMGTGEGELITLREFNSKYLKISDLGYEDSDEAFDYQNVPAAYNTVVISKLILLSPNEINRLLRDLGSTESLSKPNIALGFIQTLDGDNQWAEPEQMIFAKDCNAYRKIFMRQAGEEGGCSNVSDNTPDPVIEGFEFELSAEFGDRKIYEFEVNRLGKITVQTFWRGSHNVDVPLAVILNGPGRVGYYVREDGDTPLNLEYEVTAADLEQGNTWRISVVNFSRLQAVRGKTYIFHP